MGTEIKIKTVVLLHSLTWIVKKFTNPFTIRELHNRVLTEVVERKRLLFLVRVSSIY